MFRDHETVYLVASVILVLLLTGLAAWYEIDYRDMDSLPDTIVSIGQGVSSAVAVTLTILATAEIGMLISEKYRARRFEEGRKVERRERDAQWKAWLARRDEAAANGEAFDEPPPSEEEVAQS